MPQPFSYNIQGADLLGSYLQGQGLAQQQQQNQMKLEQQRLAMQKEQEQAARKEQYQQDLVNLAENPFDPQAYVKMASMYPEWMEPTKQVQQSRSKEQLQNDTEQIQKITTAIANKKYDTGKQQLIDYKTALDNSGRKNESAGIGNIIEMFDENPDIIAAELNKYLLAQMGPKEFTGYLDKVNEATRGSKKQKTGSFVVKDKNTDQYSIVAGSFDPATGEMKVSSGQLPDSWEMVSDLGETKEEKIKSAVKQKAQEKTAELSVAAGDKAATQVMNIMQGQEPINEAIRIVEDAIANNKWTGTGPIEQFWPKWTATAANLQSVANRLGLAELSKVTLGAVSEKEMQIVQEASFPKNLSPPDLLKWLKDRKAAQDKIAAVLTDYASYVGKTDKDGNIQTQSDWINNRAPLFKNEGAAAKKQESPKPAQKPEGPQIFNTMSEAEAASMTLPKGTRIQVGNEIFEVE